MACSTPDEPLPEDAWVCPEARTIACGSDDGVLYVESGAESGCDALTLDQSGPFAPGTHTVTAFDSEGDAVCSAELTVTDDDAPVLEPQVIQLWPPNHKLHAISVQDCVRASDACDGDELQAEFIWASSDEPVDDIGDGHHAPDIFISNCESVSVRAERQGPKEGRVYKLGVRAVDRAGNASESECLIIVDHDQRGVQGADSGEAYRIELDGTNGSPECDGEPPPDDDDTGGDGDGDGDDTGGDGDGDDTGGDGDGDDTGGDGDGDDTGGDGDGDDTGGDGDGDDTGGDGDGDGDDTGGDGDGDDTGGDGDGDGDDTGGDGDGDGDGEPVPQTPD